MSNAQFSVNAYIRLRLASELWESSLMEFIKQSIPLKLRKTTCNVDSIHRVYALNARDQWPPSWNGGHACSADNRRLIPGLWYGTT